MFMPDEFVLDPRLAADTIEVDRWDLSLVLLMNDANYPWLILVPQRPGLRDIHDLLPPDLLRLSAEIVRASNLLIGLFPEGGKPDKMNVAALGNQVPQLHVHVIARFVNDPAWPKPVWGAVPPQPYTEVARAQRLKRLRGR
jgi:diadenosine tetraphosphate (Ap4A) HIT family hydrolase